MNKSILLSGALIATLGAAVLASSTFAATGTSATSGEASRSGIFGMKMSGHGMMNDLTDAEKTALESMTPTEEQAWLETKRTETEAKRDAREAVVDKLLAGTPLTSSEEAIRAEIIKERAEMKVKRAEMEAKRTQIEAILTKKKAGTTLTTEEQALVDSMPKMGGKKGGHGPRGNAQKNTNSNQ